MSVVIEKNRFGENAYELDSRLLKDRAVFLTGTINDEVADNIVKKLLFLEADNPEKDIYLYINSPGGVVSSGLAIVDTMNYIKCDVSTICIGSAASMGAFILSAGKKGKRYATENAEIMIHQVLGGAHGQATDVAIAAKNILRTKERMNKLLAKNCDKPYKTICRDTERDYYMFADEAKAYGIIDEVLYTKEDVSGK